MKPAFLGPPQLLAERACGKYDGVGLPGGRDLSAMKADATGLTTRGDWPTAPSNRLPATPGFAAHARHLLGDIAIHSDRFDAESGAAHYRQALVLAEPRGMRPLVAHCHFGLGQLYRRTSDRVKAQEPLTTAATMYREMGMSFWLEKAEAELGPPHENSP